MKTFYNIEEMKKFYNQETNLFYIEDSMELKFNLDCTWDINAYDINAWTINARDINARHIKARNIKARDINAVNINAFDINARDINYYAVCFAYYNIRCKSIKGERDNCREFVLDGNIIIEEENYEN